MSAFLLRRLFQSLSVVFVMSFIIYGLIGLMPGDPIDLMIAADPELSPDDIVHLKKLYGLDVPLWQRYLNWLSAALGGDFGYSRLYHQPVLGLLTERLIASLCLLIPSLAIALAIAVPLGTKIAMKPYSKLDYAVNFVCFGFISVPVFWLALILIMVFSVQLGWLPSGGTGPIEGGSFIQRLPYFILPVSSLSLLSIGVYIRHMRGAGIEQMRQDYVRTARAKGVSETGVMRRHVLRNALIPVVTLVALDFGTLFSGALVIETIFSWPGMGKMIFDAIMGNDYNLALIALLLATVMTLLGNFLADIAYVVLDPRISYESLGS